MVVGREYWFEDNLGQGLEIEHKRADGRDNICTLCAGRKAGSGARHRAKI